MNAKYSNKIQAATIIIQGNVLFIHRLFENALSLYPPGILR